MVILRTKQHLEEHLSHNDIPSNKADISAYQAKMKTWKQDDLFEVQGIKARLKASFLWKWIKVALPLYRIPRLFFWTWRNQGANQAFGRIEAAIFKNRWIARPKNRRFLRQIMPDQNELAVQREESHCWQEKVSILVPIYNVPEKYLRDMIESVRDQSYENWQLCLADGSDETYDGIQSLCLRYQQQDHRICYQRLHENLGIAGNTNACAKMAQGNYIVLFDQDDMLHPSALYECVREARNTGAEFIYTDEMTFLQDHLEDIVTRHYKPDFSPENLRGVNYICHLVMLSRKLIEEQGLLDDAYNGSQDHELILRLTAAANQVVHIPKILYFWRVHKGSVSMDIGAKEYAIDAGRRAVADCEARLGRPAQVVSSFVCATHYRLTYEIQGQPLVSILVWGQEKKQKKGSNGEEWNMDASQPLYQLLSSIQQHTTYSNYEIIVAESLAQALEVARGEYVVSLLPDSQIVIPDWIQMLLMYAQRSDVALAAGVLMNARGVVQEAGYITGLDADKLVTPIGTGDAFDDLGYMGRMYYAHNINACSLYGAMISIELLRSVNATSEGGLSSGRYLGLAVCQEMRAQGKLLVLNPYVLFQCQTQEEITEQERKNAVERLKVQTDPYYSPNLTRDGSWSY